MTRVTKTLLMACCLAAAPMSATAIAQQVPVQEQVEPLDSPAAEQAQEEPAVAPVEAPPAATDVEAPAPEEPAPEVEQPAVEP
ncbi:MAG TPA: hypothetical protein VMW17_20690 [Candidatus Binatia bacterium]|nr:hypothetical protein [Candidatus Binatia bacterium]